VFNRVVICLIVLFYVQVCCPVINCVVMCFNCVVLCLILLFYVLIVLFYVSFLCSMF